MSDQDESMALIAGHRFILRAIVISWHIIAWMLGISGIAGGAAVIVGPANAHGGVTLRFMGGFGALNEVVAAIMIVAGVMILLGNFSEWMETLGHFILGITYGWWGYLVIYIIFILHQDSSLVAVTWSLSLMGVHLIAVGARLAIWQFMRKRKEVTSG